MPDGRHCFELYLARRLAAGADRRRAIAGRRVRTDLRTVADLLADRPQRAGEGPRASPWSRSRSAAREPVPHWWPASLLTGAVARDVRITERRLPLRDATAGGSGLHAAPTPRRARAAARRLLPRRRLGARQRPQLRRVLQPDRGAGSSAVVVSVDYRLAPEHRMPTAAEDAYAATVWLAAHGGRGRVPTGRGSPWPVTARAATSPPSSPCWRATAAGRRIAHQVLIYPSTDGTLSSPSLLEHADGPILTLASVLAYRAHYLGPDGAERDVRLSPLLADDLSGLPPALVQSPSSTRSATTASRYAEALRLAGNEVRFTEYVGAPHGYISIPGGVRGSRQAMAETVRELTEHLFARTG